LLRAETATRGTAGARLGCRGAAAEAIQLAGVVMGGRYVTALRRRVR
jgi:hypothetical protein